MRTSMESPALMSLDDFTWASFTYTLPLRQASAASLRVLKTLIAQRYLSILTVAVIVIAVVVVVMMSAMAFVIIAMVVVFFVIFFRRLGDVAHIDAQER